MLCKTNLKTNMYTTPGQVLPKKKFPSKFKPHFWVINKLPSETIIFFFSSIFDIKCCYVWLALNLSNNLHSTPCYHFLQTRLNDNFLSDKSHKPGFIKLKLFDLCRSLFIVWKLTCICFVLFMKLRKAPLVAFSKPISTIKAPYSSSPLLRSEIPSREFVTI